MKYIIIVSIALLMLAGFCMANDCTIYIDNGHPSANDNYDREANTIDTPYKTFDSIAKYTNKVIPGDVVCVREGTYIGFKFISLQGTEEAPIVFKPYDGEHVTILLYSDYTPSSDKTRYYGIHLFGTCKHLVFEDFEITDNDPKIDKIRGIDILADSAPGAIKTNLKYMYRIGVRINRPGGDKENHNHIVFRNLEIHKILGIGFDGFGHDLTFENNHVYDNGYPRSGYPFYTRGDNHIYRGNVMHDNTAYGIHMYGKTTRNALIENNIIYNITGPYWHISSGGIKSGGVGIILYASGGNNIIRNNIIFNNTTHGIKAKQGTGNIIINNTIFGNGIGMEIRAELDAKIVNNIVFNNTTDMMIAEDSYQSNNLAGVDPLFVDPDNLDFHITENSPARNAGIDYEHAPELDFEGTFRRDGSLDIGADEYGGVYKPDINCDNRVDAMDLGILMSYWNTDGNGYSSFCNSSPDIDSSGMVDNDDASILW